MMTRTTVLTTLVRAASLTVVHVGRPWASCPSFCLVYGVTFQPRVALNCARGVMTGLTGLDAVVKTQTQFAAKFPLSHPGTLKNQHSIVNQDYYSNKDCFFFFFFLTHICNQLNSYNLGTVNRGFGYSLLFAVKCFCPCAILTDMLFRTRLMELKV